VACARSSGSTSLLSFTNFHVFYFLPLIFFYSKILCQNISPSFRSQNLLMDFLAPKFLLAEKILHPNFSFQNLSISKNSNPNFTKFSVQKFFLSFFSQNFVKNCLYKFG